MLNRIAQRYATFLLNRNIIKQEGVEVQIYGLLAILIHLLNYGAVLILASLSNSFVETTVFFLFYIPVRNIAGGWHASTPLRCGVCGIIMWAMTIVAGKFFCVYSDLIFQYLLGTASLLFLCITTYTMEEVTVLRKISLSVVVAVEIVLIWICFLHNGFQAWGLYGSFAALWNTLLFLLTKYNSSPSKDD